MLVEGNRYKWREALQQKLSPVSFNFMQSHLGNETDPPEPKDYIYESFISAVLNSSKCCPGNVGSSQMVLCNQKVLSCCDTITHVHFFNQFAMLLSIKLAVELSDRPCLTVVQFRFDRACQWLFLWFHCRCNGAEMSRHNKTGILLFFCNLTGQAQEEGDESGDEVNEGENDGARYATHAFMPWAKTVFPSMR